jgi:hypothetical protein
MKNEVFQKREHNKHEYYGADVYQICLSQDNESSTVRGRSKGEGCQSFVYLLKGN